MTEFATKRLLIRQWKSSDFPVFAELNADPVVMEHFPRQRSRAESDEMALILQKLIAERGWGFWAVALKPDDIFIGFVGLHEPGATLPCSPCVEIGWRLHQAYWGKGYATEAATRVLDFAFGSLALDEVVSFTALANQRSQAVMERLGMQNTQQNFRHPDIPADHPVSEHVLYKISAEQWKTKSLF